ncbi:MAG: GNAT family N-acetyltransferase [Bauldia sp.]|uniref:GNAT family N-acetyltransferase n=1 Tax=Bauldia sp. TaxID=2575872 RepID=UPI001D4AF7F2|nr:GNAT family N-acetyltransferase [Bauldia sp.]MCB1496715.1 GNAT family N-acetyltransferase [Bauldia sp.]
METIPLKLDGYTDLPPGKLANVVTYLEMTQRPAPTAAPRTEGWCIRKLDHPSPDWYRAIIGSIGEEWLWVHIPLMPEAELAALMRDPGVEIHAVERGRETLGVAELDRRRPGEVEIVMFGVVPEAVGTGAAHHLMEAVLDAAFGPGVRRVWLHTCTNDHPSALRFYRRAGFRPYKFAIEVMDDPRLSGAMSDKAAPHIPVIRAKT